MFCRQMEMKHELANLRQLERRLLQHLEEQNAVVQHSMQQALPPPSPASRGLAHAQSTRHICLGRRIVGCRLSADCRRAHPHTHMAGVIRHTGGGCAQGVVASVVRRQALGGAARVASPPPPATITTITSFTHAHTRAVCVCVHVRVRVRACVRSRACACVRVCFSLSLEASGSFQRPIYRTR